MTREARDTTESNFKGWVFNFHMLKAKQIPAEGSSTQVCMPLGKTPRTEISTIVKLYTYKFEAAFNFDEATHPCINRIAAVGFI